MVTDSSAGFTKYSVSDPCGSMSQSKTVLPALESAAERFTAVDVLPVPPFWFAMAIIFTSKPPTDTCGNATPQWFRCVHSTVLRFGCQTVALWYGVTVQVENVGSQSPSTK